MPATAHAYLGPGLVCSISSAYLPNFGFGASAHHAERSSSSMPKGQNRWAGAYKLLSLVVRRGGSLRAGLKCVSSADNRSRTLMGSAK